MTSFAVNVYRGNDGIAFNDIYLDENGQLAIVYDEADIYQTCANAILLARGDFTFNTQLGIPYEVYRTEQLNIVNNLKLDMLQALLGVDGVAEVEQITFEEDRQLRALNVVCTILLDSGAVITVDQLLG